MTESFTRADDVLWRRTSCAVLVLPDAAPEATVLSGSAVAVWDELGEPRGANEIVTRVAAAFAIDETTCARGVLALLGTLRDAGAVTCSP